MPALIGIVADDLTGAADTGIAFLSAGLSALVRLPGAAAGRAWVSLATDVLAVDTRSRAAGAEYARRITTDVVSAFLGTGVVTLYKKIDSTLRGHVGDEVRAAIEAWHPESLAIVAPAFPDAGRTTVDGRQYVHGMPLEGPALVPALFEQAGISTCRADLACVRGPALESTLLECRHRGTLAVVCDAETNEDLRAIARAAARLAPAIVWVGSGGLARAMAAEVGAAGRRVRPPPTKISGPLLIVVGSRSEVARSQADDVAAAGVRRVAVPVGTLAGGSATTGAHRAWHDIAQQIGAHLGAGDDVLVTVASDHDVHDIDRGARGQGDDDPRLMSRLGELLRPCEPAAGGLFLTGGDTAVGVLEAWGTTALGLVEEIDPGVVLSETVGPRAMPVVTKAGSFGDRGTITRARQRLRT